MNYKVNSDEKWQYLNCARSKLNASLFGLYTYLFTLYNDKYGYAYPSFEQMKNDLQTSERTLKQDLALLESFEYIVRERGHKGQNTRYYFPHYSTFIPITKEEISLFRQSYNKKKY